MKNISVLLVEDDNIFAFELEMMLKEIYKDHLRITHCVSAEEAAKFLASEEVDLLLIDVILETENAGIELAETINPLKVAVIFITAFHREDLFRHALKAHPANFLHKPFSPDYLRQAIEIALSRRQLLFEKGIGLDQPPVYLKRRDGKMERVPLTTIIAIEAYGNYCHFHLTDNRRLTTRMKLKDYHKILPTRNFQRVHRSWVINLTLLESIDKQAQEVTVSGVSLPIGLQYKATLLERLP